MYIYIYIYSLSCLYGWPRNVHNEFDRNAIKFCLGTFSPSTYCFVPLHDKITLSVAFS